MKIGIFGDSFAARADKNVTKFLPGLSWPEILEATNKNYKITNYAFPGSSIDFSYLNYLNHCQKFDKCIFVYTHPHRFLLPPHETILTNKLQHICGIHAYEQKVKMNYINFEKTDFKIFKKLIQIYKKYTTFFTFENEAIEIKKIIAKQLQRLQSANFLLIFTKDIASIEEIDKKFYEYEYNKLKRHSDLRHCHLNQQNNYIFAEMVNKWIEHHTPFNFDIKNFKPPTEPFDQLFTVGKI